MTPSNTYVVNMVVRNLTVDAFIQELVPVDVCKDTLCCNEPSVQRTLLVLPIQVCLVRQSALQRIFAERKVFVILKYSFYRSVIVN